MTRIAVAAGAPPADRKAVGTWWDRTQPAKGKKPYQSRYYSIRSDLDPEETKEWGKHLDIMYEEYTRRLIQGGGLRRRTPEYLNVFLFARQQDYLDTLRLQFGLNAMGSGGVFFATPRGGGLAFFTENLPRQRIAHVAQHEGFHQFAHAFFGTDLPPWLNEGLAEFFGHCVVDGKAVVVGQAPQGPLEHVRACVEKRAFLPFVELLQMDPGRWNANVRDGAALLQYLQSWAMVHFLVYGDGGKYQAAFQRMLQLVNAGTLPYAAMRTAFGLATDADVRDFENRWVQYMKEAKPSSFVTARTNLEFMAEGLRTAWERGARPASIAELRKAMEDDKFQYPMTSHGYTITLRASDAANFAVPQDPANPKPIAVELVANPEPRSAAAKKLEEKNPTPPTLRTRGMQPKDMVVIWKRRADSPEEFDYDVTSK